MKQKWLFAFASLLLLFGCEYNNNTIDTNTIYPEVWVPVYISNVTTAKEITFEPTRPTLNAGKIYVYNQYVFQNELHEGFHVIDHSNANDPKKIGFIKVVNSNEIAIKNNIIFSNNLTDLVAIDISDITKPVVIKRIPNAFPIVDQERPLGGGYFQCPDASKGFVSRWEVKRNTTANCRR